MSSERLAWFGCGDAEAGRDAELGRAVSSRRAHGAMRSGLVQSRPRAGEGREGRHWLGRQQAKYGKGAGPVQQLG